jgi:hypothetical protein
MKKVLLTTTAMAFAASMASAGDYVMSGSIKLTYGSFGTGTVAGGADDFTSEADVDVKATSEGGNINMAGTLEIDEGATAAGPVSIQAGALTFTYDNNDLGALSLGAADGEDDAYGDYSVAFKTGGIEVTYTKDQDSSDNAMAVSYAAGALTLSMTALDESGGAGVAGNPANLTAGVKKTTIGAKYVTGPYTINLSGDDQATQNWDASVAMKNGDTTLTVAADETEMMSVGIAYTSGSMTLSARQEFNNVAAADDETEISLSYTEGALTFGAAMDSGNANHYGDEAETVINASYVDGDVTVAAKGTDQDEMEVSVTFAF